MVKKERKARYRFAYRTEKTEASRSLGLSGHLAYPTWQIPDQWWTLSLKIRWMILLNDTENWTLAFTCTYTQVHMDTGRQITLSIYHMILLLSWLNGIFSVFSGLGSVGSACGTVGHVTEVPVTHRNCWGHWDEERWVLLSWLSRSSLCGSWAMTGSDRSLRFSVISCWPLGSSCHPSYCDRIEGVLD